MDTRKQVSRLLGLEIDEVSLVDRPANQHGLVTITKRDEAPMAFFDAEDNEVDEGDLQVGDVVYDEDGEEYQMLSDEDIAQLEQSGSLAPDDASELDGELVGKAGSFMPEAFQAGKKVATRSFSDAQRGFGAGRGKAVERVSNRSTSAGAHLGRNAERYGIGAAAGTTGAVEGNRRGRKVGKSMGEQVLEELSKAYTDGDRDQVFSKAIEEVSKADRMARVAIAKAERLEYNAEVATYVELAKGYELPVDPEDLGPILHTIAKSGLTDEQLNVVDRIFAAAGESVAYDEIGTGGIHPSGVMGLVESYAGDIVGKADMSTEQATVALFEQNPDAYLEYLTENA